MGVETVTGKLSRSPVTFKLDLFLLLLLQIRVTNLVYFNRRFTHRNHSQIKIHKNVGLLKIVQISMFGCWSSFCMNYCVIAAWHQHVVLLSGSQVALIWTFRSSLFFKSVVFLIFLVKIPKTLSKGFRSGQFAGPMLISTVDIEPAFVDLYYILHGVYENVLTSLQQITSFCKTGLTVEASNTARVFLQTLELRFPDEMQTLL